ncbi:uncharacterized protein LOC124327540 isoform X2 [Daphnia pulicaria]|uniref:uncharacterized protein LOC124327540 isoform X2 n=1 Tax=Daphnia pulicaria TaxID=35523 RepID=UPI001EEA0612|nr:uncharacterized protein LOC124327540 isoform X2 [Daphnia pulicaria]
MKRCSSFFSSSVAKLGELLQSMEAKDSSEDGMDEPLLPPVPSPQLANNAGPMEDIELIEIDDSSLDGLDVPMLPLVLSSHLLKNAELIEAIAADESFIIQECDYETNSLM